jgi:phosphoribosylformimino-5-aminoimidazole carboxamide ribotide isomerase
VVGDSPLATAKSFKAQGAEFFHMVDLDGALKGNVQNLETVKAIVKEVGIPVQLGGGIRSLETIDLLISLGVARVILGTAAINNPELVKKAVKAYGEKIAVGIDAKNEYVAAEGWLQVSKIHYLDFGKQMEDVGVKTIIYTDISKDGTLTGPNFEQTIKLNETVSCDIIASGGMKDIEDLRILRKQNLYGAIVGKAIYSGNINLEEAIKAGR